MAARQYRSTVEAKTLSAGINNSVTSITLNSVTTLPSTYPYTLVIDPDKSSEEILTVTASGGGNSLTVTRGQDGTSAQSHDAAAVIKHMITARDLQEPQDHIAASSAVHGLTGSVVGTSDTQTLTNKTLSGAGAGANTFTSIPQASITSLTTDLGLKAPLAAPTFTGTVVLPSTTSIGTVSATEIGYVDGVTSAIQTQLDTKAPIANPTFTGTVAGVTKAMVGLGSVDNTTDANKPVSTATQTALNAKANLSGATFTGASSVSYGGYTTSISNTTVSTTDLFAGQSYVGTGDYDLLGAGVVRTLYVELYDSAGVGYCRPMTDNDTQNGSSSRRWTRVFAVNTTISSSDERDKLDINDSPLGLDFINDLRPVAYRWKVGEKKAIIDQEGKPILDADGNKTYEIREGVRKHYGLISQEVKQAVDNSGVDDFAGWVQDDMSDPDSHQSISYEQFIAPLIKSVQELSAEVQTLKAKVAELEAK
jgi:hypothetical protein